MLIVSGPVEGRDHIGIGHPERPGRIAAVMAGVDDLHLGTDLRIVAPVAADVAQMARVHGPRYLEELECFCRAGGGSLDPDTFATPDSWSAARLAAGAGLAAVEALRELDGGVAFVAARPPGHHALSDRAMGFCLLNNVAITAAALTANGERVLVIDWDVHHGNGTQAIFWDDPNVLYVSTHQWPLFPGSGVAGEIGGAGGLGRTVNIPLPAKATGDIVRRAIEEVALPVIDDFAPTWVLVSAGFDAHRDDPLADLALSSGDFADLARLVAGFAPRPGRLVLFLEGGYDLDALRMSVATTLGALMGGLYQPEDPTFGGPGTELVAQAREARAVAHRRALDLAPGRGGRPVAMIRTIAVGFDGSPDAEPAVRWAIDLAKQIDGEVAVVHAIGLLEHAARPGMLAQFEEAVQGLFRERGIEPARVHWHPVDGDPCSALIRAARAPVAADLVVVGSRGQGAHSGLLLGSTSLELAEHTVIPLVIVPTAGTDPG